MALSAIGFHRSIEVQQKVKEQSLCPVNVKDVATVELLPAPAATTTAMPMRAFAQTQSILCNLAQGERMHTRWTAPNSIFLLTALFLCSCNGSINPFHASPSNVTKAFYMSCNIGDYSKAESTLSPECRQTTPRRHGRARGWH